jgi:hypothetical protein
MGDRFQIVAKNSACLFCPGSLANQPNLARGNKLVQEAIDKVL